MDTNVFAPSRLITVLAKDDIDFNAMCSTGFQHFHGTSMTARQFESERNLDGEISCNTDIEFTFLYHIKKVLQIPESCTNVKQLNFQKGPLYAQYIEADITSHKDERLH